MKQVVNIITAFNNKFQHLMICVALITALMIPGRLYAQTDSTQKEEAVKEELSLIAPTLEFICVQKADNSIDLKPTLTGKVNEALIKFPLLKVSFVQVSNDEEKMLGYIITNQFGKGVLNIKADSLKTDKEGKLYFKAVFAGNNGMEPAEAEASFKRARIEMVPLKEDSLLTVQVKLIDIGSGKEIPVAETPIGLFVKRQFFPLKIGEGTTDENGEATIEIPNNLPGDAKGNITLLAKIDEDELYGYLETGVAQQWGVPVSDKLSELPPALWSEHPPVWMRITFFILMATVWGHYLVIVIQLFRLKNGKRQIKINKTVA